MNKIYQKHGILHWYLHKLSALLFFIIPISLIFFQNISASLLLLSIFLYIHIELGITTVIEDYVHDKNLQIITLLILRVLSIFFFKFAFLFLYT